MDRSNPRVVEHAVDVAIACPKQGDEEKTKDDSFRSGQGARHDNRHDMVPRENKACTAGAPEKLRRTGSIAIENDRKHESQGATLAGEPSSGQAPGTAATQAIFHPGFKDTTANPERCDLMREAEANQRTFHSSPANIKHFLGAMNLRNADGDSIVNLDSDNH